MSYNSRHETITFISCFFIVAMVILGGIGAGAFTAHENNIKSRKVAIACAENGGTFHQESNEMTCDGVHK
jgi:hypothetical protein